MLQNVDYFTCDDVLYLCSAAVLGPGQGGQPPISYLGPLACLVGLMFSLRVFYYYYYR